MNKHLVAATIAGTVGLAGLSTAGMVAAQSNQSSEHPTDGLVSALAEKFHLNKDDVQAVFDAQHQRHAQEREATVKEQLSKLVSNGTLTQTQADKILAKRDEIHTQREANRSHAHDKTSADMHDDMENHMSDLRTWAKDNGIPAMYLRFVVGEPGGPHGAMHMHMQS
ncbi:MAG TPA: hypothetical protein VL362_00030 [Patescibacteria group bacterium]|nr:hypothetical protein [Patescibacteria group bacterium]